MSQLDILQPQFFRVEDKIYENDDTFTLNISCPNARKHPSYHPGQFNMLYAFGIGEVPISISGDPADPLSCHHTIKIVGKVTKALSRLNPGELVGVRGPFGSAWPVDRCKNRDVIIIGGGIGLAPLRGMIYTILNNRSHYGKVSILYGAREPRDRIFVNELEQWERDIDGDVMVTVDFAGDAWHGNVGVVTTLIPKIPYDLENAVALLCGPEVMLRFTIKDLLHRGIRPDDIYVSMERNMKCAIGHCGRCQFVPHFICKDGPVFPYTQVEPFFGKKEV